MTMEKSYMLAKMHRMPYLSRSFFCKRAIEFVAMLWKETCNLRSIVILSHDYGVSRHLRIPLLW